MLKTVELNKRLKKIRLLISDIDGVLTDGSIIIDDLGKETKKFSVRDGLGFFLARQGGLKTAFLTAGGSKALEFRAKACGIDYVIKNRPYKLAAFKELCRLAKVTPAEVLYVGDDLIDLPVITKAGIGVAVADAVPEVRHSADYITKKAGGQGAVREVVEKILKIQGVWELIINKLHQDNEKNKK